MNELSDSIYPRLGPGEVRLVSIFPGSGLDDLLLCFSIMKLEEITISHEALSYVWGNTNLSGKIRCNYSQTEIVPVSAGITGRRDIYSSEATHCVKVTPNLRKTLLQLRIVDNCRTLWIDSICIDQEDPRTTGRRQCMHDCSVWCDFQRRAKR